MTDEIEVGDLVKLMGGPDRYVLGLVVADPEPQPLGIHYKVEWWHPEKQFEPRWFSPTVMTVLLKRFDLLMNTEGCVG